MKKHNFILAIAMGSLIAVSVNAANDDAVIKKARELQISKKYDDAIRLYESGIKNYPSERLFVDYAALLINLKKYKECNEMLSKALKTFPDSLRIKNALGQAKYKLGDLSGASSLFSQVLGKDPDNKYAKTMLDNIRKEKVASSSPIGNAKAGANSSIADGEDVDFSDTSFSGGIKFKISDKLSKEEQEELAKKLYKQMADPELSKEDTNTFIKLHKQVIEKCPLTDYAQESCWRLSNLYMLGVEPPEYDNCIACLEHLLKQYPDTELLPDAKNRLLIVSQKMDDYTRVCALYKELFEKDPEPEDEKTYMIRALEYGNALVGAGNTAEAEIWYNKVIEKDGGKNALEARAARRKLGELGK